MKSFLKNFVKKALFNAKLYRINALLNRCYILVYHMIVDKPTGLYPEVSTAGFEIQMAHLAKNYKILSLDEIVSRIKNNGSLHGCVGITFDDGFKDNYDNAYPILKKYHTPATIFLNSGRIEDGKAPWFMQFRNSFIKTKRTNLQLSLKDNTVSFPMSTKQEKIAASDSLMAYLKGCQDEERLLVLDQIYRELGVIKEPDNIMLTWEQVKEMSENGISFGAHTTNHPILSKVSLKKAEEEISQSKKSIEDKTGKSVNSFAYPFGKQEQYNDNTISILKKLSFSYALTTELGAVSAKTNLFEINRCYQGEVRTHDFFWTPYS